jgi:hypothetical protein
VVDTAKATGDSEERLNGNPRRNGLEDLLLLEGLGRDRQHYEIQNRRNQSEIANPDPSLADASLPRIWRIILAFVVQDDSLFLFVGHDRSRLSEECEVITALFRHRRRERRRERPSPASSI